MSRARFSFAALTLLLVMGIILSACATPTAETIVQTVEVEKEVTKIVEGTPVVETIKEMVVVTATAAPTVSPYDEKAPIKIMADTTRAPAVDLFVKAYPEYKDLVQYMTDDRGVFLNKLLLYNNVGSGWMDVIFHETSSIRQSNTKQYDFYPADLRDWLPLETINQFYPESNAPCTATDGKLICLRNDIAPMILYFNVKNMKDWGYTVPTTWEEFLALAQDVSKNHPGTVMGSVNTWIPEKLYFVGSECPLMNPISSTMYRVNFMHPNCQRMSVLLDELTALGVMDLNGAFAAATGDKFKANEWLTWIGPNWQADFIINGVFLDSTKAEYAGIVGMAPMVKWADQKQIWTGSGGGAAWAMSRFTKNPLLAAKLILFVTTDPSVTSVAVTQSAFQPGGDAWSKELGPRSPLIAKDPDPFLALQIMAGAIWPDMLEGPPMTQGVIDPIVTEIMAGNKTWVESAEAIQAALVEQVTKAGFEVEITGP